MGGPGGPGGFGFRPGGPGGFGPPGGRFGPPPQPGQVLPSFVQDTLKMTDEQKKQLEEFQKEVTGKLDKVLTADQQKQLKEEVKQLLAQAEAADEAEDRQYGSQRGDELPEELRRRETRLARIKEAKKVLEQRARDKTAAEGKSAAQAKPEDQDQYNFTDPESRIMKGADGIVQGYNAQAAVEPTLLLIVGQAVTEAANDKKQLKPMVELIEQQSGQRPEAILADNGYCSEENLEHLESAEEPERQIEGFIATGKQKHGEHRLPAKRGPLPKGATRVERMKRKLQTKVGKAVYAARKCVVEPVFGQIKQARGFRQFLLRGKEKVKGEWALLCLTHNVLRLHAAMQPC